MHAHDSLIAVACALKMCALLLCHCRFLHHIWISVALLSRGQSAVIFVGGCISASTTAAEFILLTCIDSCILSKEHEKITWSQYGQYYFSCVARI